MKDAFLLIVIYNYIFHQQKLMAMELNALIKRGLIQQRCSTLLTTVARQGRKDTTLASEHVSKLSCVYFILGNSQEI